LSSIPIEFSVGVKGEGILIHKVFIIWLVRVSSNQGGRGSFPLKRDADQTNWGEHQAWENDHM